MPSQTRNADTPDLVSPPTIPSRSLTAGPCVFSLMRFPLQRRMDMLQTVAQWLSSVNIAEPDMNRRRGRMAAQQPGPSPQRQPAGTAIPRPTALDAFRLARRTFQAGDRVDMQTLARTLQVDRVTVYRWVGSREQLLTEV